MKSQDDEIRIEKTVITWQILLCLEVAQQNLWPIVNVRVMNDMNSVNLQTVRCSNAALSILAQSCISFANSLLVILVMSMLFVIVTDAGVMTIGMGSL